MLALPYPFVWFNNKKKLKNNPFTHVFVKMCCCFPALLSVISREDKRWRLTVLSLFCDMTHDLCPIRTRDQHISGIEAAQV